MFKKFLVIGVASIAIPLVAGANDETQLFETIDRTTTITQVNSAPFEWANGEEAASVRSVNYDLAQLAYQAGPNIAQAASMRNAEPILMFHAHQNSIGLVAGQVGVSGVDDQYYDDFELQNDLAALPQDGYANEFIVYDEPEVPSDMIQVKVIDNNISIKRHARHNATLIEQFGHDNIVSIIQAGAPHDLFVRQVGAENEATISQYGLSNAMFAVQDGGGNAINVAQFGDYNALEVTQEGHFNHIDVVQADSQSAISIIQHGNNMSARIAHGILK